MWRLVPSESPLQTQQYRKVTNFNQYYNFPYKPKPTHSLRLYDSIQLPIPIHIIVIFGLPSKRERVNGALSTTPDQSTHKKKHNFHDHEN